MNILHYLYLNGVDIHNLSIIGTYVPKIYDSLYTRNKKNLYSIDDTLERYLKVISQDFDYLNNEHDDEEYKKPSFWKHIDYNADEQLIRINEWKNRFDEHVLHHLSKMIQEWMLA